MRFILLLSLLIVLSHNAFSQCINAPYGEWPLGGPHSITCGGQGFSVPDAWTGEYTLFSVETGKTYTFSSSVSSDFLTLTNSNLSPILWSTNSITWTASFTGTVRLYRHLSNSCNFSQVLRVITATCVAAPAGTVTFYFGESTDWEYVPLNDDVQLDVPVRTIGFSNMGGFQYTIDLGLCLFLNEEGQGSRQAVPEIISINNIHPAIAANLEIDNFGSYVTIAWSASSALSLADQTKLFDVRVEGPGEYNYPCCTHLRFVDDPITIEAFNFDFEPLEVIADDQHHLCQPEYKICGCITREDGLPIGNVTVNLLVPGFPSPIGVDQYITGPNGCYEFTNLNEGGTYFIVPTKRGEGNPSSHKNGVNIADIKLIREYAGGKDILSTPYKIVAADVITNARVTVQDALFTQRVVAPSSPNTFEPQPSWKFVASYHSFPIIEPPLSYNDDFPMSRELVLDGEYCSEDFIGIKMGDVNLSNNPLSEFHSGSSQRATEYELFKTDSVTVHKAEGSEFVLTVRTLGFTGVREFQASIKFNIDEIEFLGAVKDEFGLPKSVLGGLFIDEGNAPNEEGRLYFAWFDASGEPEGIDIAEDEIVAEFRFKLLNSSLNEINFDMDTLTDNFYTDAVEDRVPIPIKIRFEPVRVDFINGTSDSKNEISFTVEPNPAQETIRIRTTGIMEQLSYTIIDIQGKTILNGINNQQTEIDIRQFPAGLYFIQVQGEVSGLSGTEKFVKN